MTFPVTHTDTLSTAADFHSQYRPGEALRAAADAERELERELERAGEYERLPRERERDL